MRYQVTLDGRVHEVSIEGGRDRPRLLLDGRELDVEARRLSGAVWSIAAGGRVLDVEARRLSGAVWSIAAGGRMHLVRVQGDGDGFRVEIADRSFHARVRDEREVLAEELEGGRGGGSSEREVRGVMPGVVTRVVVRAGEEVAEGRTLLYVEAMKMENEVRARSAGKVKAVKVKPGDTVASGQVLVELM